MTLRILVLSVLIALPLLNPLSGVSAQQDPRYFAQTRYRIDDDRFFEYFQRRGGVRTFGYPVSHAFPLLGQKVQIFQRQVMQLQPNGSVGTLNLLDEELMPYTKINGSTFPAIDPALLKRAPGVGERDYHLRALQFVQEVAPEQWNGARVNFFSTFMGAVTAEDAFPDGRGERALLAGFNLELWGLPTSLPIPDPANGGFIYQRFQRGIMHYDASCGCTQGLLLGYYFKALLTGDELPADLAAQARKSRFLGQYRPEAAGKIARPKELSGTELGEAFQREPLVVVDPGHGGKEIGSAKTFPDGTVLTEKELALKIGLRVVQLLTAEGFRATPTRSSDRAVNEPARDLTGDDKIALADELQARVDLANNLGADLLLSIHFNGVNNPTARGTQVFYSDGRPHSERSRVFAELTGSALVKALAGVGFQTVDRKASADSAVLGGDSHYYLLGPRSDVIKRPSTMPAVISETLFLSNDDDAAVLRNDRVRDALAVGYVEAIKQYFSRFPAR